MGTINCLENEPLTLSISNDMSILDIKNLIALETGIMCNNQKLIMNKKLLLGNENISELEMIEGSNIDLIVGIQGGATSTMDPAIVELSKKYNHNKMICRGCYATLPPRALKCRKRACGHMKDIRPRKAIKTK